MKIIVRISGSSGKVTFLKNGKEMPSSEDAKEYRTWRDADRARESFLIDAKKRYITLPLTQIIDLDNQEAGEIKPVDCKDRIMRLATDVYGHHSLLAEIPAQSRMGEDPRNPLGGEG